MGVKLHENDIDFNKVGQLINSRIQNITTIERASLGGTLNSSHKGLIVFDVDLNRLFSWTGSVWEGNINIPGNASTVTTNANLTGIVTSVGNATAIADNALAIAKTSGLQTSLDSKVAYNDLIPSTNIYAGKTLKLEGTTNLFHNASSRFTITGLGTSVVTYEILSTESPGGLVYPEGVMTFSFWSQANPTNISVRLKNASDVWYGPFTTNTNLSPPNPDNFGYFKINIPGNFNFIKVWEITYTGSYNLQELNYIPNLAEGVNIDVYLAKSGGKIYGQLELLNTSGTAVNGLGLNTTGKVVSTPLPVYPANIAHLANTSGTNTGDNATNSQYSGLATSKQDTLVSGTNLKTINGNSLLGSGNIVVSGGSTNNFIQSTAPSVTPGTPYTWWDTTGGNLTLWIENGI